MQFKIICTKTILYVSFVCCWMYPYFLNLLYLCVLQVFAMIGCSPVLALTKVPSYSMTTIIAFQNGLQKSSSSMKVWQSWKYKKFTGLACGDAESKYWIRFSRGGGGEIKKDKRWENFKSDLGVTLQGNRGRLPAHLELLARISSLHHHALNNKISSRPTMHWVGDWWSWWWCWSCWQPAGRAPPPGPPALPAGWRGLRATSHHVEITLEQDNCREGQKIRSIWHFFPLCPLPAAVEEAEVPFCVGFKEDGFNLRQRLILLIFLLF